MRHFFPPLLVLVRLATAQLHYDSRTQGYRCAMPNAAYCAGSSNTTNIIVRCEGRVGHAANCNDNLVGFEPVGVSYSPCIQSSDIEGDAACSKNGKIYRDSGAPSGGAKPPGHAYVSFSTQAIPVSDAPSTTPAVKPRTGQPGQKSSDAVPTSATSTGVSHQTPNMTTFSQGPVYTGGAVPLECFSANSAVFAALSLAASFGGFVAGITL